MWSYPVEGVLKYPAVFLAGFLGTYLLTPLMQRLAPAVGLIDMPDARRVHKRPTPRCGISVFLGFHLACAVLFLTPWRQPFAGGLDVIWWARFFWLSCAILAVGLVDDRRGLRPWVKLAGQVAVAVAAFYCDMRVGRLLGVPLPFAIDLGVTVLWFAFIINAFNLIDGMDGLATGLAGIAALGLGGSFLLRHLPGDALILFGFVGACWGFLRYNFSPATIFLGDSGSMFLGFTLAAVALGTGAKGTAVATIAVPLLAVGVPIFDTALAVWRRTVRRYLGNHAAAGEQAREGSTQVFGADMDHIHHKLLRRGLSTRAAATWLYALGAVLTVLGLLSMLYRSHALGIYIIAFLLTTYVAVRHLARIELWDSGRAIVSGLVRPPRRILTVLLYPPLDVLALAAALGVACAFSDQSHAVFGFRRFWLDRIPLWVGVPFLSIFAVRTYQRVWSRARISEFALLALCLVGGILLAAGLASVTEDLASHDVVLVVLLYVGLAIPLVVGFRVLPRAVLDAMVWARRLSVDPRDPNHTLVFGTNEDCRLFLRETTLACIHQRDGLHIVGLLDEDRNLQGRFVNGYPVLGGVDDLPALVKRHHVENILIIQAPEPEVRERLTAAARELKIGLRERRVVETTLVE